MFRIAHKDSTVWCSSQYRHVSMLHCNSELPSLRPMETTKFDMMWSCFTSREMLCIEILCAYIEVCSERATPNYIAARMHSNDPNTCFQSKRTSGYHIKCETGKLSEWVYIHSVVVPDLDSDLESDLVEESRLFSLSLFSDFLNQINVMTLLLISFTAATDWDAMQVVLKSFNYEIKNTRTIYNY